MHQYMTRPEVKARAKQQLREPGVYKNMVLANLIPWLIAVVFAVLLAAVMVGMYHSMQSLDFTDTKAVTALSQSRSAEVTKQSLIEGLIGLWFAQGVAFTALDVYRGKTEFNPLQAVFRLFNGRFFFGILLVAIFSRLGIQLGTYAFIVPGILLSYGWSQVFYVYYDGRTRGPFGAFQALGASWRLMRGFKIDFFVFQLSLIGWYLLQAVTLHLFDLFINPYLQVATAGFYDNVRDYQASLMTNAE